MDFLMPLPVPPRPAAAYAPAGHAAMEDLLSLPWLKSPPEPTPAPAITLEHVFEPLAVAVPAAPAPGAFNLATVEEALPTPFWRGRFTLPTLRLPWQRKERADKGGEAWAAPTRTDLPPLEIREEDRRSDREDRLGKQILSLAEAKLKEAKSDMKTMVRVFRKRSMWARWNRKPLPSLDEGVAARDRVAAYAAARKRLLRNVEKVRQHVHQSVYQLHLLHMLAEGKNASKDLCLDKISVTVPWDELASHLRPVIDVPDVFPHDRMAQGLQAVVHELKTRGETDLAGRYLVASEKRRMERVDGALRHLKSYVMAPTNGLEFQCNRFDKRYEKAMQEA